MCAASPAAAAVRPVRVIVPRPPGPAPAVITGPLINHGGPVQNAPRVYVDFWGWTSDPSGEKPYLTSFVSGVGGEGWLATVGQYGGGWGYGLLAGTWSDPAPVPASPSDAQIQAEAAAAASHFGTGNSVNVQIVVATPTGHSTPGFGSSFCAYHGKVAVDPNITYTDLPYMTDAGTACGEDSVNGANGTLDGVSIVEGHELAETITDPLLNAWYDAGGNEIGDKCAWSGLANAVLWTGKFAVQPLWSNAANGCVLKSPLPSGPFEEAFQANTGSLIVYGTAANINTGLGMMAGTSPAIAASPGGGFQAAFQANTGSLYIYNSATGPANLQQGMKAGTSPSITALSGGGYEEAFQANSGSLIVFGNGGDINTGLGMMAGTSPAIAASPGGGFQVTFQANTGSIYTYNSASGAANLSQPVQSGTSPAIAALSGGGYEEAFQHNSGNLAELGSGGNILTDQGIKTGTSPAITGYPGFLG